MLDLIILCIVIGYGLCLGLGNTCTRIHALLINRKYHQNTLGQLLDAAWFSCIVYLLIINGLI